jgi:hypothetical protein
MARSSSIVQHGRLLFVWDIAKSLVVVDDLGNLFVGQRFVSLFVEQVFPTASRLVVYADRPVSVSVREGGGGSSSLPAVCATHKCSLWFGIYWY